MIDQQIAIDRSSGVFDVPVHLLFCDQDSPDERVPFNHPAVRWTRCASAADCLQLAERLQPDAMVIDGSDTSSWAAQLCRSVLDELGPRAPLLFVWSRSGLTNVRQLLEAGATDVLEGPFDRSAALRLWAHLRRQLQPPSEARLLRFGDLSLDLDALRVRRNGRPITLPTLQRRLLEIMLRQPFHVFTRDELIERLWNGRPTDRANLRTCMRRLRQALNAPGEHPLVSNVRHTGYSLDGGAAEPGISGGDRSGRSRAENAGRHGRQADPERPAA